MSRYLDCPHLDEAKLMMEVGIVNWYPCLFRHICEKTGDCPAIKYMIKPAIRYQRNVEVRA